MSEETKTKKPREEWAHNCTAHCVACGAHFTGTSPFDVHRENGECVDPAKPVFGEKSVHAGKGILQALAGRCDKEPGCWKDGRRVRYVEPVTLWQSAVFERDEVPAGQGALF